MKSLFFLLTATLISSQAFADAPPQHNCTQPVVPNTMASDIAKSHYQKMLTTYKECMSKYVEDQQAIAKTATDMTTATLAHDAAESAIKEYNDFIAKLNARNATVHSRGADSDDGDD
jgi:hypothetical protein